jgi:hypothetical protein
VETRTSANAEIPARDRIARKQPKPGLFQKIARTVNHLLTINRQLPDDGGKLESRSFKGVA